MMPLKRGKILPPILPHAQGTRKTKICFFCWTRPGPVYPVGTIPDRRRGGI